MLKKLTTITSDEAKYIEATLTHIAHTPSQNLFLQIKQPQQVIGKSNEEQTTKIPLAEKRNHLLVPRRRQLVFQKIQGLELNQRYVFKLIPESRSKTYTVCEVFEP